MKKLLSFSTMLLCTSMVAQNMVQTYPAPEGAPMKDDYLVEVRTPEGEWQKVDTYMVLVDEVTGVSHHNEEASMAYFDFEGQVEVRVTCREQEIRESRIRPLSSGVVGKSIDSQTLTFLLEAPCNLSVEINGDIYHNLHLFANPIDPNNPLLDKKRMKRDKSLVYIAPGYYNRDDKDPIRAESGKTYYVAGGAYIHGGILIDGAENVKVLGRGILRPTREAGVRVSRSKHVEVEGVIVTQCPVGESDDVTICNVKSITNYGWGDGMNIFASSNILFDGVFCRNSDDCTTVYATRMGYVGSARNITIQNSVLWADVAHAVEIGLHGAASYEVDVKSRNLPYTQDPAVVTQRIDTIENLRYRNLDIFGQLERQVDYQGCLAITCGDNNVVRDVVFEDIRIDDIRIGQMLTIRILHNQKYCQQPGLCIEDITFRNLTYTGRPPEHSIIAGFNEQRKVRGITFENLVINGTRISDDMPGKPKWYKTADMARFFVGDHVENLVFK